MCVLVVHTLIQNVFNWVTGMTYSYINPFTLTMANLSWVGRHLSVNCKSIKFHFSILGFCNKLRHKLGNNQYCFWYFDSITIDLTNWQMEKTNLPVHKTEVEEIISDGFDFNEPFSIYLGRNWALRFVLKWTLYFIPAIGVEVCNLTIICPNGYKLRLKNLNAQTNINTSFERERVLNDAKLKESFHYWLTNINLENLSLFNKDQLLLSTFFDIASVSLDFQINLSNGIIKHSKSFFRIRGTDVSFIYIAKFVDSFLDQVIEHPNQQRRQQSEEQSTKYLLNKQKKKLLFLGSVYKVFHSVNISCQNFKLSELPILNTDDMLPYIQSEEDPKFRNVLFSSFFVDSLSWTVEKLNSSNVGYNLKYVDGSYPVNWLLSAGAIKASLDFSTFDNYKGKIKKFEILSIPNIMISVGSTMLVNLIRSVLNNDTKFDQRHTLLDLQCSVTKLTLDVSSEQLGILISSLNNVSINRHQDSVQVETRDSALHEKLLNIIFKTNPNWSIKLLFEKPTIIIKSENESSPDKDIHIAYLSPSLINFEFDIVASLKSLEILTRFDIPNLNLFYQRNNDNKNSNNFFVIKDVTWKNSFKLLTSTKTNLCKNDQGSLRCWFDVNFIDLKLDNLSTLNGLREILFNTMSEIITKKELIQKEIKIKKKIHELKRGQLEFKHKLFSELPRWLKRFKISINDINLKFGSKSILMNTIDDLLNEKDLEDGVLPSALNIALEQLQFDIGTDLDFPVAKGNASSSQSEASKPSFDYYYYFNFKLSNLVLTTDTQKPDDLSVFNERIIELPLFVSKIYVTKVEKLEFVNFCPKILLLWSVSNNFTTFSVMYMLKHTVLKYFVRNLKNKNQEQKQEAKIAKKELDDNKRFMDKFNVRTFIKEIQFKFKLSQDFHGRLDLFGTKISAMRNPMIIKTKIMRLSVKKDFKSHFYNRLLTFEYLTVKLKMQTEKEKMKLSFDNSNVKLSVPSNFIVHTLFEAIKLSTKMTKRFVYILKTDDSINSPAITETKVSLPTMRLKSRDLSFVLEDDPFESEIGSQFQLGLVEQKLRLAKYKEFNKYLNEIKAKVHDEEMLHLLDNIYDTQYTPPKGKYPLIDEVYHNFYKLKVNISKSWQHTVQEFKLQKTKCIKQNYDFLSGTLSNLLPASSRFNSHIVDFNGNPPLMGIIFRNIIITVSNPSFHKDSGQVEKFVHRIGKGYPEDSKWNQLVPLKVKLVSSEVRVHLRDYPLPLVYIPGSNVYTNDDSSKDEKTFTLTGDLVIAELMPQSEKELWERYVPVFHIDDDQGNDEHFNLYGCNIVTTICKTKLMYEAECLINSSNATTATWSNAYQNALRHLDCVFDGFSKPTRDLSLKLGVWDKMRDIIHGSIKFVWINPQGEVQIRVPNATDPYKILTHSAGFSLNFKEKVEWLINDPEREFERDYFIFKAESVTFGVPNYLALPLPSWNSNKMVFFPSIKKDFVLASMFGYYLNTDEYFDPNDESMSEILKITSQKTIMSSNIELDGQIELKLSLSFERDGSNGERVSNFKPHWENLMTNPTYVKDKDSYDAYEGFRSNYIHMSLSLRTEGSNLNSLRLTPRSVRQFLSWFKKFKDNSSPPIRHGPLWNFKSNSVKLGKHLMTFKFKFLVEPLYIYHGYRLDLINPDNNELVALKGKIGRFMCDLHERKEKKIKHVEFLDKQYNILSMGFYLGCVDINDIDLRAIGLKFDKPKENHSANHRFEIFDKDESWINLNDFNEIDLPEIDDYNLDGEILPLVQAKHFKYSMDKQSGKSDFGFEDSHECGIDLENFPKLKFNHIFDIENVRFKWYRNVRNLVFDYFSEVAFRDAYIYSAYYGSRKLIKTRLEMNKEELENHVEKTKDIMQPYDLTKSNSFTSSDPLKILDELLHKIGSKYKGYVPIDDMVLRFKDIQAQLMSNLDDENIILLHAKDNNVEIILLTDETELMNVNQKPLAKRFGTVFESANLYVISKKDFENEQFGSNSYGSAGNWPIFLNEESSKILTSKNQIFNDICIIFFFEKVNSTMSGARGDLLYMSVPSLKVNFTSLSYRTFFDLAQRLLIYSSPVMKKFNETTEAILNSLDDKGANDLFIDLEDKTDDLTGLTFIQQSNNYIKDISPKAFEVDTLLRAKTGSMLTEVFLIVKSLILRTVATDKQDKFNMEWFVTAADLNVDFIDEDHHKFLNFTIKDGTFTRVEAMDGSNSNSIKIRAVDIQNEDSNILFPQLLTSLDCKTKTKEKFDDMINIRWKLGSNIGGLHDVKLAEVTCNPMKIALEDKTGIKLMNFLFPEYSKDNDSSDDDSDYDSMTSSNDGNSSLSEVEEHSDQEIITDRKIVPEIQVELPEPMSKLEDVSESSSISSQGSRLSVSDFSSSGRLLAKPQSSTSDENSVSRRIIKHKSATSVSSARSRRTRRTSRRDSRFSNDMISGALKQQLSENHIKNMKDRADKYLSIGKFKVNSCILSITLYGTGKLRLINVNDLMITIPSYKVTNKTWGYIDLVKSLKRHIIKTLLRHSGSLLKNKLFVYKRKRRINKKRE